MRPSISLVACALVIAGLIVACERIDLGGGRRTYLEPPADSYASRTFQLSGDGQAEQITGAEVSVAFFPATNAPPLLGRSLHDEDYRADATAVALLREEFWRRVFKGAPDIIGKPIQIDGRPTVVVGIMPRGFDIPKGAQVWVPRK